jgi:hypothetical protein
MSAATYTPSLAPSGPAVRGLLSILLVEILPL